MEKHTRVSSDRQEAEESQTGDSLIKRLNPWLIVAGVAGVAAVILGFAGKFASIFETLSLVVLVIALMALVRIVWSKPKER